MWTEPPPPSGKRTNLIFILMFLKECEYPNSELYLNGNFLSFKLNQIFKICSSKSF